MTASHSFKRHFYEEFWSADNDSNRFIREQLKTNALKNVLNNFFTQMELNSPFLANCGSQNDH